MRSGPFEAGDKVLLIDPKGRKYLLTLRPQHQFSSHLGTIPHSDMIGREEGSVLRSSRGAAFAAFRPTFAEYALKMKRGAQVLYPKDIATVLIWGDIFPGTTVVEGGGGSGALTIALLQAVGEKGQVITYELREDFLRQARTNVEAFLGKVPHWMPKLKDIYEGIEETSVDRVILDVPEGWRAVRHAAQALRPGGLLLAFYPTVPQLQTMAAAIEDESLLVLQEVFETVHRPWRIQGLSVRPQLRMVAHTGFFMVARRMS
ncbi:MAG: tRNA (adenine-N1)-methyltransferase [candidate division NC10 bacterium]|nr:tRNA (adenine-N1)-methyltransferase [candidate division NC10 bacterium]